MRPIETIYGGCRFRSRLEARWAVFFDSLGLPWEYEPEGFELRSGRYLPDFRVVYPGRGAGDGPSIWWFECKPHMALVGAYEWARMREFDSEAPLIVLDGPPDDRLYLRAMDASADDANEALRDGWALWSRRQRPWLDESQIWFGPFGGHGCVSDVIAGAVAVARFTRFGGPQ